MSRPSAPRPRPCLRPITLWTLLLCLSPWLVSCTQHDEASWLVGRWEVAYNPKHEDNDALVFDKDGKMAVWLADGRKIDGRYEIDDSTLILDLAVPKRPTQVRIRITPDHGRLVFKNGAYYEKKKTGV